MKGVLRVPWTASKPLVSDGALGTRSSGTGPSYDLAGQCLPNVLYPTNHQRLVPRPSWDSDLVAPSAAWDNQAVQQTPRFGNHYLSSSQRRLQGRNPGASC